ncbi:duf967 domain protein [Phlyctema vagabunda]|uniref:Duf967 domain protein n=1 Tax=Phlyctema vagabunda TaxID=108571 RepID=A0ABR4PZ63_9HELO
MAELQAAPTTPAEIAEQESSLIFPSFTSDDAFTLGCQLRTRLRALDTPKAAVISIVSSNSARVLFHAISRPGAAKDNERWIERKTATVLRWGHSTWYWSRFFDGDEDRFATKLGLSPEASRAFAIHGGAVPVVVQGVEDPVAVVVVSGLKQDQDHMVVVEGMQQFLKSTAQ